MVHTTWFIKNACDDGKQILHANIHDRKDVNGKAEENTFVAIDTWRDKLVYHKGAIYYWLNNQVYSKNGRSPLSCYFIIPKKSFRKWA